jgi:hydrogenase maturation protease
MTSVAAMKILVAGVGNMFLGDDGFGPAVIERFRGADMTPNWPTGATIQVVDFGIRGMDLAYALTSGIDAAVLIDATARGGVPGTLYVIEPTGGGVPEIQTHAMDPARVLAFAATIGPLPGVVRVIGCEPARIDDPDITEGLSPAVVAAIEPAARLTIEVVAKIVAEAGAQVSPAVTMAPREARCTS